MEDIESKSPRRGWGGQSTDLQARRTRYTEPEAEKLNDIPDWAAALGAVTPVLTAFAWAAYKIVARVRSGNLQHQDAQRQQRAKARREALQEAYEVVDRLRQEIEELNTKVDDMADKERRCIEERSVERQEHATVKTVLRMLIAWAQTQRKPPAIPTDVLDLLNRDPGSGFHQPLPEGKRGQVE